MKRLPGWMLPVVALLVVAAGVWWFVFRESDAERGARLIQEARVAMDAQDFATAEARLNQALEVAPHNGLLLHNLGIIYLRQDRLPEARDAFAKAAAAHGPEASEVRAEDLFQLATISYKEKKWSQAAGELQQAIAAHPQRAQLHTRLLDLQLGRLQAPVADAESTTVRFLRMCGRTPSNLEAAAFVHYQHKAYDDAIALARQAVALEDSFTEAHSLVARSLWKSGQPGEGLAALDGPLRRYPNAAPLWIVKSLILLDTGARRGALAAADRAVALAPRSFDAHQARERALAGDGQLEAALKEIDIARELTQDPNEQRMLLAQQRTLREMIRQTSGGGAPVAPLRPPAGAAADSDSAEAGAPSP